MRDLTRPEQFVHEAIESSLDGKRLRIVLFSGETVEGAVTETNEDGSKAAMPDATPLEEATFGPIRREITIGDRSILVADISSLDVIE